MDAPGRSENPFEPPRCDSRTADSPDVMPPLSPDDPEPFRRAHLDDEKKIKAIGCLFMLFLPMSVNPFVMAIVFAREHEMPAGKWAAVAMTVVGSLFVFEGIVGIALWQLRPWTRVPATIIATIMMILTLPIGIFIYGISLRILIRERSRKVLSHAYMQIVRQTATIRPPVSRSVWFICIIGAVIVVPNVVGPFVILWQRWSR